MRNRLKIKRTNQLLSEAQEARQKQREVSLRATGKAESAAEVEWLQRDRLLKHDRVKLMRLKWK
jgi:hypothetical protein